MSKDNGLSGLVLGLAESATVLIFLIPRLFDGPEVWQVWGVWVTAGGVIACGVGTVMSRRRGR
ncbi:hypothetical protein [Brevibacterium spongiae]|uniref:Uncharacterized protein n=1 Tax=Brevibacterium spongiae TaxID=2909672 RepID=A0ABY5SLK1_9MICO|nr:hypothetical protein [Brevibacterium spongiae]UVI35024.1 hypothetical protein L1F31_12975 [Brevibacterium spongiae]